MTTTAEVVTEVEAGNGKLSKLAINEEMVKLGTFFEMSRTGLTIKGKPSIETCGVLFDFLGIAEQAIQFSVGDAINYVESVFGEKASQIVDVEKLSESSIKVYRWVSAKVPPSVRRDDLTYSHHQEVAHCESVELMKQWLAKAAGDDGEQGEVWSVARLKREMKAKESGGSTVEYSVTVTTETEPKQQELVRQLANLGYSDVTTKP